MPDYDPSAPPDYNSMQQQMGLIPPIFQPPPIPFPGQVSAAMAQGGVGGAFMTAGSPGTSFGAGAFPAQQLQTYTNQNPMLQGPTGIMMPMSPGAAFNPYASANPYAGLSARGPYQGPPGLFTPLAPAPPMPYAGQFAGGPVLPPPPASQFNTAYMAGVERHQMSEDSAYGRNWSAGGVGARIATDFTGGMAGAMLGRRLGTAGAIVGGLAGFMGAEMSGAGQFGQNAFMNNIAAPFLQQRAMAGGIEEMSRSFINTGGSLNASGMGFTHHAAAQAAAGIREMAGSSQFQRETGDRFNMQDLMKVAQESSRNDMMGGVQSAGQMTSRVRDIAKSLSSFMELAQEPDIQRAIQTMGQLRASGLNLAETNQAVAHGRAFARMAGTSFSELSAQAGAIGSQTAQSMGLTQGLGMRSGMMNYALARGSQNGGQLSPQLMNLVGGAQGLAGMNNLFGNSMLQMPMLAPSVMSSAGGINAQALQGLLSGNTNAFGQTSNAVTALQGITNRQGIGGLGAAIAMQPLIQDTIGRAIQNQGLFAQRNFEDTNVMNTMRGMGLHGSGGFLTMAQAMGTDRTQAVSRARELASPSYWNRQRDQIEVTRSDERQTELERREALTPGIVSNLAAGFDLDPGRRIRAIGRGLSQTFHLDHHDHYSPETDAGLRRDRRLGRSAGYAAFERETRDDAIRIGDRDPGFLGDLRDRFRIANAAGFSGFTAALNLPNADASTEPLMRNLREGSRMAGVMSSTSRGERDSSLASMSRAFGSTEALGIQQDFASQVNTGLAEERMGMGFAERSVFNIGMGAAQTALGFATGNVLGVVTGIGDLTGATTGDIGARQLGGSDYRSMFIRAATGRGVSRKTAEEFYDRDPSAAVRSISTRARITQTEQQTANMFEQAQRSQGLGAGRGAMGEAIESRTREARTGLFGENSARLSDEFQSQMERIQGPGLSPEGEQRDKEQRFIMASGMLSQRLSRTDAGSGEYRRLAGQIGQMREVAVRQGIVTDSNQGAIDQQILTARDSLGTSAGRDISGRFADTQRTQSGAEILTTMTNTEPVLAYARRSRMMAGGAAALAAGSGALGARLREAGLGDETHFDAERYRSILRGASEEDLADASPEMRRAAAALRSGSTEELDDATVSAGTRSKNLHAEYRRTHSWGARLVDRVFGGGEDEYVNAAMARTTDEDRVAETSTANVNAAQALAQRVVGTQGDPMLEAATQLRRAAEALRGAADTGSLERAYNQ